ncbi:MAG: anti-sigma factor [Verrucomicrobiota bacterium]
MSEDIKISRFDELDAARALGDLTVEEAREFDALKKEFEVEEDFGLDELALDLEVAFEVGEGEVEPRLRRELLKGRGPFLVEEREEKMGRIVQVDFLRKPLIGWAVAACLAVALLWPETETREEGLLSVEQQREELLEQEDVVRMEFSGGVGFEELDGDVVWSDVKQEGYLSFSGLEVNDPEEAQYQLWIVDPERDSAPVDGGVFDVLRGGGVATIPIRAALRVDRPVAFVVTREQPGGVVVSKQEVVAAIAQRS